MHGSILVGLRQLKSYYLSNMYTIFAIHIYSYLRTTLLASLFILLLATIVYSKWYITFEIKFFADHFILFFFLCIDTPASPTHTYIVRENIHAIMVFFSINILYTL